MPDADRAPSAPDRAARRHDALPRSLVVANTTGTLLSTAFCVAGLVDPGLALPHGSAVTDGVRLYAQAYAARTLPLGAALVHQLLVSRTKRGLLPLLTVAGVVQIGDVAIGLTTRNPGMAVGAGALAVLHLASAARLARADRRSPATAPAAASAASA
ncbi:hypothetical protein [Kitasatospora sp. NPDC057541]|uniref:hypothetical protein n=1 Tax=unclassified Kitasatospora TaxID=2633591 RepID=UPI00368EB126